MFLRFASSGERAWFGRMRKRGLANTRGVSQFDVGGHKITIQDADLGKFPSSKLYQMTQPTEGEIKINRSGALFEHVKEYLQYGQLPRGTDGKVMMDEQTLKELREEADYYGLDRLSAECGFGLQNIMLPDFQSYFAIKGFIEHRSSERSASTDFFISSMPSLMHALKCLWVPFCVVGELFPYKPRNELGVSDFVTQTSLSTINDSQSCTIDGTKLNGAVLDTIIHEVAKLGGLKELASHLDLTLHPKELVIHQAGFSQIQGPLLCSPNNSGHIGTLVVILDSAYTGGELEVTHNGHTKMVMGPYNWVAMYGDCLHKINPVTSGTRATLIFDIYGKPRGVDANDKLLCFQKGLYFLRLKEPDLVHTSRPLSAEPKSKITQRLKVVMEHRDSIVLSLQHQYHYSHLRQLPTVDVLTGGDRVLYELLVDSGDYDVEIISFTIYDAACHYGDKPTVRLFTHDSINNPMPSGRKRKKRIPVVMQNVINKKWILREEWPDDGYGCHTRESLYLVSGLLVSKKKK